MNPHELWLKVIKNIYGVNGVIDKSSLVALILLLGT